MPGDSSGLSFLDKQFIHTNGCALTIVAILVNGPALILGIVGLIACKHPAARKRAMEMTQVAGFITFLAILAVAALIFLAQLSLR